MDQIRISDVTMKQTGKEFSLSFKEKLEIPKLLDRLNVDVIELEGKVLESLPNAQFKVELPNGHVILAHISGKLRMNFIRIIEGDTVKLEMSPYNLTSGRITWRGKS